MQQEKASTKRSIYHETQSIDLQTDIYYLAYLLTNFSIQVTMSEWRMNIRIFSFIIALSENTVAFTEIAVL